MDVIARSCVLFLWLQTLTFVKSQKPCTLQQFIDGEHYDSNFDTTDMADSYPGGKQVRVGCNVGYSGFFELICVEGRWETRGTKCQPRSCGHPGDAEFGLVQLVEGDDFVFGSKVLYICQKRYHIVSGTKYRRCLAEGWDGEVPVCELFQPVGCGTPPSLKHGDIKLSEKANYSHNESVEYQCQSYYTMEGEPFRTCYDGTWTGQMRCIEPCIVNEDDHKHHNIHNIALKSDDRKYFTHDEIIEYRCTRGIPVGSMAMRQRCNSGLILLPSCQ